MKKLLSVLCVFSLLLGCAFTGVTVSASEYEAANFLNTVASGNLKCLTPDDFGIVIEDGFKVSSTGVIATNTVLSGNITFQNGDIFIYPKNNSAGIQISAEEDSITISDIGLSTSTVAKTVTEEAVGKAIVGNEINIKIAIELLNTDGEYFNNIALKNDLQITYYIDNIEVYRTVVIATAQISEDNTELLNLNIGGGVFAVENNDIIAELYMSDIDFKNDFLNIPIMLEDTEQIKVNSTYNTDIVLNDGGILKMGAIGQINRIGTVITYVDMNGTHNVAKTEYNVEKFNLKVTVRAVDIDDDKFADDSEIGIYIDNKRIGSFIYGVDNIDDYTLSAPTANASVTLYKPNQLPTGLRVLTPNDAGWGGDIKLDSDNSIVGGGEISADWFKSDLVDIMLSAKIKITQMTGRALFGLNETKTPNLIIVPPSSNSNTCKLQMYCGKQIFINGSVGFTFGEDHYYQHTVEKADVDLNGDGVCNDLRLGCFIDGELVNGNFFYLSSANIDTINNYYSTEPAVYLESYGTFEGVVDGVDRSLELPDYEILTMEDIGQVSGTYTPKTSGEAFGANSTTNFINKVFETELTVSSGTGAAEFVLGNRAISGGGVRLKITNNIASINAAIFSSKTHSTYIMKFQLPDFKFDLNQKLQIMIAREDGDYKIGVWIDGKLQNNRFYYGISDGATLINQTGFYFGGGTHTWEFDTKDGEFSITAAESYTVTPSDTVAYTLNDEAVTQETTISKVGEHALVATTSQTAATLTSTKIVVIYMQNDISGDGNINVLDFITMMKNIDGEALTRIGAYAAGVEFGASCTTKELVSLKKALLGVLSR